MIRAEIISRIPREVSITPVDFRQAYYTELLHAKADVMDLEEEAFRVEAPAKRGYSIDEMVLTKVQTDLESAMFVRDILQALDGTLAYKPLSNGCTLTSNVQGRELGVRVYQAKDQDSSSDLQIHYSVNGKRVRFNTTGNAQPYLLVMQQLATGAGMRHLVNR